MKIQGVQSIVLAQVDFGTPSPKPTRLLLKLPGPLHPEMYEGMPTFDAAGFYSGPLPRKQGEALIGMEQGQFKTAAAAAWPPKLCDWVARQFLTSFQQNSDSGKSQGEDEPRKKQRRDLDGEVQHPSKRRRGEERGVEEVQDARPEEMEEKEVDPFLPPCRGGDGRARGCKWKGQEVPFHDGGCLLSPGRWDRSVRWHPGGDEWTTLRAKLREAVVRKAGGEAKLERECFSMPKRCAGL